MESIHQQMYKAGLVRSTSDNWFGGVCGGLARKLNIDANAVRLLVFVFMLMAGSGLVLYILAWIAMPDDTYVPSPLTGSDPVIPVDGYDEGPQDIIPPRS